MQGQSFWTLVLWHLGQTGAPRYPNFTLHVPHSVHLILEVGFQALKHHNHLKKASLLSSFLSSHSQAMIQMYHCVSL